MLNTWNQYQCMATFNLSRSASFYETGIGRGMGFRDSNQDLLGFVHLVPERARRRMLDLAATQLSDGTCFHQYQPLTKQGNADIGGGFNDDPLWLVLSTCAYVKETGDVSILDEPVGYADTPGSGENLLHHLETSIAYTLAHRGPHGLPLIGHADWNDCLNLNCFSTDPDESFQTAGDVEGSRRRVGDDRRPVPLRVPRARAALPAPRPAGGRGARRRRARARCSRRSRSTPGTASGTCAPSTRPATGRLALVRGGPDLRREPGVVRARRGRRENGRARQALESVHEHLFTEDGIVLHQPAYTRYHVELGEISSYPPGYKENAGVFCHTNTWITLALVPARRGRAGARVLPRDLPVDARGPDRDLPQRAVRLRTDDRRPRRGDPRARRRTPGSPARRRGRSSRSQGLLGIVPGLRRAADRPLHPARRGPSYRVTRRFRGIVYEIAVENPDGVCGGVRSLVVDGRELEGNVVPPQGVPGPVRVEVVLGSDPTPRRRRSQRPGLATRASRQSSIANS